MGRVRTPSCPRPPMQGDFLRGLEMGNEGGPIITFLPLHLSIPRIHICACSLLGKRGSFCESPQSLWIVWEPESSRGHWSVPGRAWWAKEAAWWGWGEEGREMGATQQWRMSSSPAWPGHTCKCCAVVSKKKLSEFLHNRENFYDVILSQIVKK